MVRGEHSDLSEGKETFKGIILEEALKLILVQLIQIYVPGL